MDPSKLITEAATELTKHLMDRGSLIEAGFEAFRILAIKKEAPPLQIDEMRLAWMAGADYLFCSVMSSLDPGAEPTDTDMQRMDNIYKELERWRAVLEKRIGRR